jgi:hypothetical protein
MLGRYRVKLTHEVADRLAVSSHGYRKASGHKRVLHFELSSGHTTVDPSCHDLFAKSPEMPADQASAAMT